MLCFLLFLRNEGSILLLNGSCLLGWRQSGRGWLRDGSCWLRDGGGNLRSLLWLLQSTRCSFTGWSRWPWLLLCHDVGYDCIFLLCILLLLHNLFIFLHLRLQLNDVCSHLWNIICYNFLLLLQCRCFRSLPAANLVCFRQLLVLNVFCYLRCGWVCISLLLVFSWCHNSIFLWSLLNCIHGLERCLGHIVWRIRDDLALIGWFIRWFGAIIVHRCCCLIYRHLGFDLGLLNRLLLWYHRGQCGIILWSCYISLQGWWLGNLRTAPSDLSFVFGRWHLHGIVNRWF